jgi:hypothetical protein
MSLNNAESVPKPIEVGQETATLRRFYHDSRWEGWIHEGGMGPGTPKMKALGVQHSGRSKTGAGGLATSSKTSFSWMAHLSSSGSFTGSPGGLPGLANTVRRWRTITATRTFTADISNKTGSSSSHCPPRLSDFASPGMPRRPTSQFGAMRWRAMTARGS